jgi:hypothetical protein
MKMTPIPSGLAHCRAKTNRQGAYDLLALVYNWFTEALNIADCRDAKALLDELTR